MRRGAAGNIVEVLRDDIVSLKIVPGTVLSRAALQQRFKTSSTPISDALLSLQDQGLVTIYPQHATIVSLIDWSDAEQASFLRRSIEIEVVRTLAQAQRAENISALRDCVRLQTAVVSIGRLDELVRLDEEFHETMFRMAGVDGLWDVVRRSSGNLDRIRRLNLPLTGKAERVLEEHGLLVDAIEAGERDRAGDILRDHLSQSIRMMADFVERYPNYFLQQK